MIIGAIGTVVLLVIGAATAAEIQPLPGTRPLEMTGDLSVENLVRVDKFLERAIGETAGKLNSLRLKAM